MKRFMLALLFFIACTASGTSHAALLKYLYVPPGYTACPAGYICITRPVQSGIQDSPDGFPPGGYTQLGIGAFTPSVQTAYFWLMSDGSIVNLSDPTLIVDTAKPYAVLDDGAPFRRRERGARRITDDSDPWDSSAYDDASVEEIIREVVPPETVIDMHCQSSNEECGAKMNTYCTGLKRPIGAVWLAKRQITAFAIGKTCKFVCEDGVERECLINPKPTPKPGQQVDLP
jgi:hypothetical protein